VVSLWGCHHAKPDDPAAEYRRIWSEFLKGNLDVAQQASASERTKLAGRDGEWTYRFCLLEAEILSFRGQSQDVVAVLDEGSKSFIPGGDYAIKRDILLSVAYARIGQPERSASELADAKHLSAETHSGLEGEVLRTQGLSEDRRGDAQAAEILYLKSLEQARLQHNAFLEAIDLLNLGKSALAAEHIDEALDRFNASSQIAQSIGASFILQTALGNAGWAYSELGDFDKALVSFKQAESAARSSGATSNDILWLEGAALATYRLGDLKQAEGLYEQALALAQSSKDLRRIAETETLLGLLLVQQGELEAAQRHSDAGLKAAQAAKDKSSELDVVMLQAMLAARRSNGPETERILSDAYAALATIPSERWKVENAFADMYKSRRQAKLAEVWYRKSIATFEAQRASVHDEELRLPFFANGDDLYRDYAEYMIAGGQTDRALQLFDDVRARTLEEGLAPTRSSARGAVGRAKPAAVASAAIDARVVARRLDATILFYALGPQKSYLWAVDRNGARMFVLPSEAEIAARVKRYQAQILKSGDPVRDRDVDGQWLYSTLVGPAEGAVRDGARVLVISSGSLNSFNMETLLKNGPQGLHYWIDDVKITSASSIRLLARTPIEAGARAATKKLLLIGDPVTAGSGYAPLTNAGAEIESVQKYFPAGSKTVISRTAAVPKAYSASGPELASYIHFVSHGTASSSRPLDSAILLSPPVGQPDNFKLYARDIVRQPLHAQLVTISACYGSGSRNYEGEGLVGLSWAFLRAGAHHVIGALWEVNDASTPQLMDRLYSGLAAGHEPDESLRDAKLAMMHSDGVYRKPLYWAAFQLYAGS